MTERVRLPRKLKAENGALVEAGRLHPVGAVSITLNMLPLNRVTMTLAEDDLPLAIHDLVEVFIQKGSAGIYRVTRITNTYRRQRQIELSHGLDAFADATFTGIETYSGTVAGFLAKIAAAQTQTIGGAACWVLGTVDDTAPWNKDIKYDNLMECLTEIARTEEDYVFTFDQSAFPWVLNFVRRDDTVLSEFRLSRNMESCAVAMDDAQLCTRLHLSVTTETTESVTDDSGTVHIAGKKTEEGYYTYDDAAAQQDFGIVSKTAGVYRKDVPTDAALAAWVAAYFSRHNTPALQISIDGEELLQLTGEAIDEVHMGRICRVALPDYRTVFNERVVSVTYPDALRTPSRVRVSLANKRETAENSFAEIRHAAGGAGGTASAAKTKAENDETEIEKQKIIHNLQVLKDEERFAVIASETWYQQMEGGGQTLVGQYVADFEVTARRILAALAVTGVQVDSSGNPVIDPQTGEYVFNGSGNTLSSQISQTATDISSLVAKTGVNSLGQSETLYSLISQNAQSITLKVSAGDIASTINQTAQSVLIQASKINLNGYVTATQLDTELANISLAITDGVSTYVLRAGEVYVSGREATWQSQYVITGINLRLVSFEDGSGTDQVLRVFQTDNSYSGKTIYYLGYTS